MFKDHLSISVRYPWKQVSDCGISLSVYLGLGLWDGLYLARGNRRPIKNGFANYLSSVFYYRFSEVVPGSVDVFGYLGFLLFRTLNCRVSGLNV